jgi:hypothetical protein
MVFNTTFKHISAISWWSVLLVGVPEENHRPAARHWQTLSHNVASSTPHHSLIALVVMGTDRAVVHKPNYHTITSTTTPLKKVLRNMCAMNNNHFQLSSQKKLMKFELTKNDTLVEQELLTLPEHLGTPPFFVGFVLVLWVCFVDRCLSFCPFSFVHCVVCPSIYGFWLPPFGIFKLFIQASHCLMIPLTNLISRFFFIFIFCRKVLVFNLIVIVNYIL